MHLEKEIEYFKYTGAWYFHIASCSYRFVYTAYTAYF